MMTKTKIRDVEVLTITRITTQDEVIYMDRDFEIARHSIAGTSGVVTPAMTPEDIRQQKEKDKLDRVTSVDNIIKRYEMPEVSPERSDN